MLGICFSMIVFMAAETKGETWYDSKGRALIVKGRQVTLKNMAVKESEEIKNMAEEPAPTTSGSIIPETLELRPELITTRVRQSFHYQRYSYGCYRSPRHQRYYNNSRRSFRGGLYLNYRSGNFSIRARY